MSKIKLFEANTDGVSYKQPVVRLALSVGVFVCILPLRFKWIHSEDPIVDLILGLLSCGMIIGSVLSIVIALAEIDYVAENRAKKTKLAPKQAISAKPVPIKDIIAMVDANDIMDNKGIYFCICSRRNFNLQLRKRSGRWRCLFLVGRRWFGEVFAC